MIDPYDHLLKQMLSGLTVIVPIGLFSLNLTRFCGEKSGPSYRCNVDASVMHGTYGYCDSEFDLPHGITYDAAKVFAVACSADSVLFTIEVAMRP